jgi:hypothetical protein
MDAEILVSHKLKCERRGVRFYKNAYEHKRSLYALLRKWLVAGGDGTFTNGQASRDLYPDVGDDPEAARRKQVSIWRWLKELEEEGLIHVEQLRSMNGKSLCLRYELLPVPEALTLQPTELQPRGR